MSDLPLDSAALRRLVDRTRAGDPAATDLLVRAVLGRFENLARRMLHRFPDLRRLEQTSDVVQGALVRLLRALKVVTPETTRDFFNLAAEQIRRQLLDLARYHRSRAPVAPGELAPHAEPADPAPSAVELDQWERFHAAVEGLPAAEREAFALAFYHGWTQQQIADLFGVDERTVRRRWQAACLALNDALRGDLPPLA